MGGNLHSGEVTFLFTDVEGSTRRLHELGAELYARELADHRQIVREAASRHGGTEVDTQGDAFFLAFARPTDAVAAARYAQEALARTPLRVRMGVHAGIATADGEGYIGPDVHLAARICACGHGGQVLVSGATIRALDGEVLTDLGEHRLKDFDDAISIFQLGTEPFPPLSTISNTNLPRPANAFVGRERELGEARALLEGEARLVSLTGPGGSGKTRLAIEIAHGLVPRFKAGVFWVDLAPLRDPALVVEAVSHVLGARESLTAFIGQRHMLLVLDNLEQVIASAAEIARLVESCPNLHVLATTRERLRVRGEVEYSVPPLDGDDAAALFNARSGLAADDAVFALCRALDDLPLAIELAAARANVLPPTQMLERLSSRLDLLKGTRDADPRQSTLRATIEWSYELLSTRERELFARLAVFRASFALDSAEAIADADFDVLGSLVDKSLIQQSASRFSMLESIRAFASERLDASPTANDVRRRHADHFRSFAERQRDILLSGEPEEGPVAELESEIAELRGAIDYGLEHGDKDLVRSVTVALTDYWLERGLYAEGREALERALALDGEPDALRRMLLSAIGSVAYSQGDHERAVEASDEAAVLANGLGGEAERSAQLRDLAAAALRRGDYDDAEAFFRERLPLVMAAGNGVGTSSCRINIAYIYARRGNFDAAEEILEENLPFVRSRGQTRCEATTLAGLAEARLHQSRVDESADDALLATVRARQINDHPLTLAALELYAASAASQGRIERAATLIGAADAARRSLDVEPEDEEKEVRELAAAAIGPTEQWHDARHQGEQMDLESAVEYAKGTLG